MFIQIFRQLKASPTSILFSVFCLVFIGLMSLYSISVLQKENLSNAFIKQLLFLGPAIILMIIMTVLSKRLIHKYIYLYRN